ncbi:MAG: hypothetical protein ACYDC0_13870 [Acidimicrobiales bacterium]
MKVRTAALYTMSAPRGHGFRPCTALAAQGVWNSYNPPERSSKNPLLATA